MLPLHPLIPQPAAGELPPALPDPFATEPHALAKRASEQLQQVLENAPHLNEPLFERGAGKMFGVLVVRDGEHRYSYLAAFSGRLHGQWRVDGFVPPLFDVDKHRELRREGGRQLRALDDKIGSLSSDSRYLELAGKIQAVQEQMAQVIASQQRFHHHNRLHRHAERRQIADEPDAQRLHELAQQSRADREAMKTLRAQWNGRLQVLQDRQQQLDNAIEALKSERKQLKRDLRKRLLALSELHAFDIPARPVASQFADKTPPHGSGDCASTKLLNHAAKNGLQPIALTEFWYGAPAADEVRHHRHYYPPCRGKCGPLLAYQLSKVEQQPASGGNDHGVLHPELIYEDADILVINKPSGLLSVPGKQALANVQDWLNTRFPDEQIRVVHRLDMPTSGLLLAARNSRAHKRLQKQFAHRQVYKRYTAIVSRPLAAQRLTIDLPLRVDIDDRPRQMVCERFGKRAITDVQVLSSSEHSSRVYFFPRTGRTHQLRVHAAHYRGLDAPITGDELYGHRSQRLMLHADQLGFIHPSSGEKMRLEASAPF